MAGRIIGSTSIPHLSLDQIAWGEGTIRKPLAESLEALYGFLEQNEGWVIEGCYGDLIEAALPHCTELRFLNPGVEVCVAHCRERPWEPEKFPTPEDQRATMDQLIDWVRAYKTRDDEYGLLCHRRIFDGFTGPKWEYTTVEAYEREKEPRN
jgi:adenylate kinase family enzyme